MAGEVGLGGGVRHGNEPIESASGIPVLDGRAGYLEAVGKIVCKARDNKARGSVQAHQIAPRTALTVQQSQSQLRVLGRVPASQIAERGELQPVLGRLDLQSAVTAGPVLFAHRLDQS
jgi:hypothetical protein